jgi:hypothetical protein
MNAKLCKRIRQFLRLVEVPHSAGTTPTRRGVQHPAGTFEHENTRLKRAATRLPAADRAKAFPKLNLPF